MFSSFSFEPIRSTAYSLEAKAFTKKAKMDPNVDSFLSCWLFPNVFQAQDDMLIAKAENCFSVHNFLLVTLKELSCLTMAALSDFNPSDI